MPEDVIHNAILTASVIYGLANRDEMLPRFSASEMPAVPPARGGRGGATPAGLTAQSHVYAVAKGAPFVVRAPGLADAGGRGGAGAPKLTAAIASQPAHGKVTVNSDGSFTYTPSAAFTGTDSFTYTVKNSTESSAPGKVTLVVK